jgi:hypothetical protein
MKKTMIISANIDETRESAHHVFGVETEDLVMINKATMKAIEGYEGDGSSVAATLLELIREKVIDGGALLFFASQGLARFAVENNPNVVTDKSQEFPDLGALLEAFRRVFGND